MNMPIKPSQALLAVVALIAAPAFAQDAAAPADEAQTAPAEMTEAETTQAPAADTAEAEPAAGDMADGMADDAAAADEAAADGAATDGAATDEAAMDEAASDDAAAAAPAEPAVGSYYALSSHQDWVVRCIKAPQGKDPCELYQMMNDDEGNSVAEVTVIPLTNGDVAAGVTLVAPLETSLREGIRFSIDGGSARQLPFSFCAPIGCFSTIGFSTGELNGLKRGNQATVTLLPFGADPKNPVSLPLSLSGFTAAFEELKTYASQPAPAAEAAPADEAAPASE